MKKDENKSENAWWKRFGICQKSYPITSVGWLHATDIEKSWKVRQV